MFGQQLWKELFVDRNLAALQGGQFVGVVVYADNGVAYLGETRGRHQAHISGTHNGYSHGSVKEQ
jgi:hypothetical protein